MDAKVAFEGVNMGKQKKTRQKPRTFREAAQQVADDWVDMLVEKQRGYGKSNILIFGEFGVLVRSSDKFERLKTLSKASEKDKKKAAEIEGIRDTRRDIGGYMMIGEMLDRETFETEPLE